MAGKDEAYGRWWLATAFLIVTALLIHFPFVFLNSVMFNDDMAIHYRWAVEFSSLVGFDNLYPRWMHLPNFGVGEPAFLYYSPGYFYFISLLNLLLENTWDSMRAASVLSCFVSGWFVLRLLRAYGVPWRISVLGGLGVQLAPFIFMLFHYFGGFPWATSFSLWVILAYYLFRPEQINTPRISPQAALTLAVLVATHVLSGLMILILFGFAMLAYIKRVDGKWTWDWRQVLPWAYTAILGLGVSMIYLYPALTSMGFISPDYWLQGYDPATSFVFPIITYFTHGLRWFAFQWAAPAPALLMVIYASYFSRHHRAELQPALRTLLMILLLISWSGLFLASEWSYPIWSFESPLLKLQFPYRFLYVVSLTAVLATFIGISHAQAKRLKGLYWSGLSLVMLSLALTVLLNFKAIQDPLSGHPTMHDEELVGYEGLKEYFPKTLTQVSGFKEALAVPRVRCETMEYHCAELASSGGGRRWLIDTGAPDEQSLVLPVLYFPSWEVSVEGQVIKASPDTATGLVRIELPPGKQRVSLYWKRSLNEWVGIAMSAASLAVLMVVGAAQRTRRKRLLDGLPE